MGLGPTLLYIRAPSSMPDPCTDTNSSGVSAELSVPPDDQSVDLPPLAGVQLKLVEERVEEGDHQVDEGHHEGHQQRLGLAGRRPVLRVGRLLHRMTESRERPEPGDGGFYDQGDPGRSYQYVLYMC